MAEICFESPDKNNLREMGSEHARLGESRQRYVK